MNIDNVVFDELPTRASRIDWYGDIVTSTKWGIGRRMIRVATSPWAVGGTWDNTRNDLDSRSFVDIPVTWLALLPLGSVWENGKHVTDQPLTRNKFERLVVNDLNSEVVPAGRETTGPDNVSRYDLPFANFNAHRSHTQSFVVATKVDEDTVLIVPCLELIRFYFGASGVLLKTLFSGAFAFNNLDSIAHRNPSSGTANLTLGGGLNATAAPAVARIILDSDAKRSFHTVVKSGVMASSAGRPWFPRMRFPFSGTTDLTAEGLWILQGSKRTFVALRLISCTHPFPFTRLYYKLKDDVSSRDAGFLSANSVRRGKGDETRVLNDGSSRNLTSEKVYGRATVSEQFPDLANKQISRNKSPQKGLGTASSSGNQDPLASGPPVSGGIRGLEFLSSQARDDLKADPPCLERFRREASTLLPSLRITPASVVPDDFNQNAAPVSDSSPDLPHPGQAHLVKLDSDDWPLKRHCLWLLARSDHSSPSDVQLLLLLSDLVSPPSPFWLKLFLAPTHMLVLEESGAFVVEGFTGEHFSDDSPIPSPVVAGVLRILDAAGPHNLRVGAELPQ